MNFLSCIGGKYGVLIVVPFCLAALKSYIQKLFNCLNALKIKELTSFGFSDSGINYESISLKSSLSEFPIMLTACLNPIAVLRWQYSKLTVNNF